MPDIINKTAPRVSALGQVARETVRYRPRTGEFIVTQGGESVVLGGAERRTFADLRSVGLITHATDDAREVLVTLTSTGEEVAEEWLS